MTKPTILYIVDDDADDQEFLIEVIKEIDPKIECFTAINGQEGLNKLEEHLMPLPSLIFLDLNMPRINGKQFLLEIKNDILLKDIPVIIYSTSINKKDIEEMMHLGANDYLVKQADFTLLKEQLNSILTVNSLV